MRDPRRIDSLFRRQRYVAMVTLTLGYGISYTCRLGLSVVKKPLIDGGVFSAEALGWIGAAFLWGYGAGKLCNGFFSDRVSIRRFFPFGLAVSALVNLLMGSNTVAAVAVVLWVLNGWFQGVGAPSCVVGITAWFTARERGTMYGIWSSAHAIGEFLTYVGTAALVAATTWRLAFMGPSLLVGVGAVGIYLTLRDRPQVLGLPSVARWKGESVPPSAGAAPSSIRGAQLSLLSMPAIWIVGIASALMYVTRYAVNNWGVFYLQEAHGYSLVEAGSLVGVNAFAGIAGSAAYGFISDRYFAARRPPLTLIFGIVEVLALLLIFVFAPRHSTLLLTLGMVVYGFTLSGLLAVLGGLFAVDIAPQQATGAAMGIIGVFSYLGAGAQDVLSGWLVERSATMVDGVRHYDFSVPIAFWIGASLLSMVLAASLWRVQASDEVRDDEAAGESGSVGGLAQGSPEAC